MLCIILVPKRVRPFQSINNYYILMTNDDDVKSLLCRRFCAYLHHTTTHMSIRYWWATERKQAIIRVHHRAYPYKICNKHKYTLVWACVWATNHNRPNLGIDARCLFKYKFERLKLHAIVRAFAKCNHFDLQDMSFGTCLYVYIYINTYTYIPHSKTNWTWVHILL